MKSRFRSYYSPDEATALIPKISRWIEELRLLRQSLDRQAERILELIYDHGDQGGPRVNDQTRGLVRWHELMREFSRRDLQIRDLETGKVDFPARRGDHEIFLIWQEGDTKVDAWREIPTSHGPGPQPTYPGSFPS